MRAPRCCTSSSCAVARVVAASHCSPPSLCSGPCPCALRLRCVVVAVLVTEAEIKRLFRKFKKLDVDKSGTTRQATHTGTACAERGAGC